MNMFTALRRYASFLLHSPILIVLTVVTLQVSPTSPAQAEDIYLPLIRQQRGIATPAPGGTIPPARGIWLTEEEVRQLPTTGAAWDQLIEVAGEAVGTPDLGDQDSEANVIVLAKALVYARTGEQVYRDEVVAALRVITFDNTEDGGRTLALGRELAAYVIAADLINLPIVDADLHAQFSQKLRQLLTKSLEGWGSANHTLQETHELRANNWGTHAGASRAAVAFYLGDSAELERTALVFRGYLGDRSAYSGFEFADDLSWQADPANPVSVNPQGSVKEGHSIDGALPEEMRRGGPFQWPPATTDYPWGGLQGALVQAEILHRAGYPAWEWEDQALKRAVQFLYDIGWAPEGNDEWMVWLVNHAYQTSFPTATEVGPGTNMGWTNWTHR
jgi:hypothetical protein